MNTPDFTPVKNFIKLIAKITLIILAFTVTVTPKAHADWEIDFSRRAKATRDSDLLSASANDDQSGGRAPASVNGEGTSRPARVIEEPVALKEQSKGVFDTLFEAGEPVQDIVIMQTEKGFVPATVRVRKNGHYKISVVNVNEKEKNVSFILDGFSEHHATYYGKIKSFILEPKKEGTYSFQSPETSFEGKLVVFNPQVSLRAPAADEGSTK